MRFFTTVFLLISFLYADLKIYTNEEPPQQFTKNNKLTGIGVDIVQEIQKRLNSNESIRVYVWGRATAITKKNKNSILFLAGKTKDRLPFYHFIGPILKKDYKLYAKSNTKISIESLQQARKAKRISCVLDDVREIFLRENGFRNLTYGETHARTLEMLLNGKSELWASSDWENKIHLKSYKLKLNTIKPVFTLYQNFNYIAFNKKTDMHIIKKWEQVLKEIKQDGTMEKIAKKWSKILQLNLKFDPKDDAIGIVE